MIDFVCIGPQRTGTTWLYESLQQHPRLYVPEAVKETMFFDRRYERGFDWYAQYFSESRHDQRCGEVASTYFDSPKVPSRVHDVAPQCTIIVSLRHPAERAFSLYLHHLRKGRVRGSLQAAVERKPRIIESGRYATHIPRWRSTFGEQQVHFVFLDDIKTQPRAVLDEICQWLGVEPVEWPQQVNEKSNAAKGSRFPWLAKRTEWLTSTLHSYGLHQVVDFGKKLGLKQAVYSGEEDKLPELGEEDRQRLIQEHARDISFVENITGRDLSCWRV
jgi:hypothetical protein